MKNVWVWMGAIVCVVLVLCLGGYLLTGAVGERQLSEAKEEARASVAVAAAESDRIERQVAVNRTALGQPLQSWSQVVCEIDNHRSGWFPDSYSQQCTFNQMDVYPITYRDRAVEFRDAGVDIPYSITLMSQPEPELVAKDDFWGTPRGTPPQWDVQGDLAGDDFTVVGVHSEPVVTELGCSPWGIGLCLSPVDHPAMP